MIEYIQSGYKTINKTLQHSIDKHKFKVKVKCRGKHNIVLRDVYPVYASGVVLENEIDTNCIEKINHY